MARLHDARILCAETAQRAAIAATTGECEGRALGATGRSNEPGAEEDLERTGAETRGRRPGRVQPFRPPVRVGTDLGSPGKTCSPTLPIQADLGRVFGEPCLRRRQRLGGGKPRSLQVHVGTRSCRLVLTAARGQPASRRNRLAAAASQTNQHSERSRQWEATSPRTDRASG